MKYYFVAYTCMSSAYGPGIGRSFFSAEDTFNVGEIERIITKEKGNVWTVINNFIEVSKEIYDTNPNSENDSENLTSVKKVRV